MIIDHLRRRNSILSTIWNFFLVLLALASSLNPRPAQAQAVPYARSFPKPKSEVEQALKDLQAYSGQKLPIIEGFVGDPGKPLSRYERGFYQFTIDVLPGASPKSTTSSAASAATVVSMTAKITAWYADSDPSKSGYQVLASNGRLELDLLDRLDEKLGLATSASPVSATSQSGISAPKAKLDLSGVAGVSSSALGGGKTAPATPDEVATLRTHREEEERQMQALHVELESLQEAKKAQAHPLNLVTVKKSGTPVLARPVPGSHVLFSATANDEFEFIDGDGEWIHVQISGASRGYIRRNSVELPEFVSSRLEPEAVPSQTEATFQTEREENGAFPGDWEPLRGKQVKIYTVQPTARGSKSTSGDEKRKFTLDLMKKYLADLAPPEIFGIVVIFDSADGGIVAATLLDAQNFVSDKTNAAEFWKLCYLDPPDAFPYAK